MTLGWGPHFENQCSKPSKLFGRFGQKGVKNNFIRLGAEYRGSRAWHSKPRTGAWHLSSAVNSGRAGLFLLLPGLARRGRPINVCFRSFFSVVGWR